MDKIEAFFEKYSWLLKLGIIILFCFWVMPGFSLIKAIKDQPEDAVEFDDKAMAKLERSTEEIAKKAEAKGAAYSPTDYYADFIAIHKMRKDFSPSGNPLPQPVYIVNRILKLSIDNNRKDRFAELSAEKDRADYDRWLRENPDYVYDAIDRTAIKSEAQKEAENRRDKQMLKEWSVAAYWRGLILALLFYLVRMAKGFESKSKDWNHHAREYFNKERRGIADTVLADKTRFVIAILFWPIMLFKYPSNVIREIIVEAELRRLGGLFRRFTPAERLKIQEIANSEHYASWRKKFRRDHATVFRYAFGVAVLATLAICLLQPIIRSEARDKLRAGPSISHCYELQTDRATDDDVGNFAWCEGGWEIYFPPIFSISRLRIRRGHFFIPIYVRRIDSVPRFGCLGRLAVFGFNR